MDLAFCINLLFEGLPQLKKFLKNLNQKLEQANYDNFLQNYKYIS